MGSLIVYRILAASDYWYYTEYQSSGGMSGPPFPYHNRLALCGAAALGHATHPEY
jgi:hypothetical protein